MSYLYSIEKLIGIQEAEKISIEETPEKTVINIRMRRKLHTCPACGEETNRIHDYREQRIKDLPAFGKPVELRYHKRRYVCGECGKKFYEKVSWLPRYGRMTQRMILKILEMLSEPITYKSVGKQHGISEQTVARIFDQVRFARPKLPSVVSIDEFKGNVGGEKYNCIIADPLNKRVLDILPRRNDWYLTGYFMKMSKEYRDRVSIFISDMWQPYQQTARDIFCNARRVIDKYHWARQLTWAFERVRKDVQKHLSPAYRRYFKRSRFLLLQPFANLSAEDATAVNVMLSVSPSLSTAHFYKEEFQTILRSSSIADAKMKMDLWIDSALDCGVAPIVSCAKTMLRWKKEILNSFTTSCTNGFIEGCNNKIKVLKRVSYGCRNFNRFRNRILFMFAPRSLTV